MRDDLMLIDTMIAGVECTYHINLQDENVVIDYRRLID